MGMGRPEWAFSGAQGIPVVPSVDGEPELTYLSRDIVILGFGNE